MASDLLSQKDWLKRTSVIGKIRSRELKEVDKALAHYEQFGGGDARWRVGQALDAWKRSKGPGDEWKRSDRNRREQAVEHLTALLDGKGDTDSAWGAAPDFMHPQLENARLGVIYLLGNLQVDSNLFNVVLEGGLNAASGVLGYAGASKSSGGLGSAVASAVDTNVKTAMIPGGVILNAAEGAAWETKVTPANRALAQRVKAWFTEFARKVWTTLKEKFSDPALTFSAVKNLVNVCMSVFLEAAAPFVSGGLDVAKGLVNTIDAAFVRFRAWLQGKRVELAKGHPTVVVDSIKRAMTQSLFHGLYQVLKGAGDMALTVATAGASMIVKVIVALGEMLIKMIWRMVEISHMDKVFREAAAFWRNRDAGDALHRRPFEFTHWYRKAALTSPALAILTLNSGICGDKMVYLSMFTDGGRQISTNEFKQGARFIDNLKPWGAEYLGNSGYSFRSSSQMVGQLLTFAQSHADQRNKVWATIRKFANA